jgi:hypothetical protein
MRYALYHDTGTSENESSQAASTTARHEPTTANLSNERTTAQFSVADNRRDSSSTQESTHQKQ